MLIPKAGAASHAGHIAAQAALLMVLLAVAFPGVFLRGEDIAPADLLYLAPPWEPYAPPGLEPPRNPLMSDVLAMMYPAYAQTRASLDAGQWPLWNPFEMAGMPLLANYQSATLYPPRLVHEVFGLRGGTTALVLLKLWLCGMAAYLAGLGFGLHRAAARFLSVAWMLGAYALIWSNWPLTDVAAWAPPLVLAAEWVATGRLRRGFFLGAFAGTLLLLAGHPETAFTFALGTGVFFCARLALERPGGGEALRRAGAAAGFWALALAVAAPQLLPFLEYLSHRADFTNAAVQGHGEWYPPGVLAAAWAPRFFGTFAEDTWWGPHYLDSNRTMMLYPGIAAWACAGAAGLAMGKTARRRAVALAAAGLVALLLSMNVPPFDLVNRVPPLAELRLGYHATFFLLAIALLGAIGLDRLLRGAPMGRVAAVTAVPLLAGAVVLTGVYMFNRGLVGALGLGDYLALQLGVAGALALLTWGGCLWLASGTARRTAATALLALLTADLLFALRGMNPTIDGAYIFPPTALTARLGELDRPARVGIAEGGVPSGLFAPYRIQEWLGYDGLYPERIFDLQHSLGPDAWTAVEPAFAIGHYLHDPRYPPQFPLDTHPEWYERVGEWDGLEVYRNRRALPRAYIAGEVEHVESLGAMLDRMRDPCFDPARTVLTTDRSMPAIAAAAESTGNAEVVQYTPNEVVIQARVNAPCVLVLADAWYPGWRAAVDSAETTVYPVNHAFRGVVLEPGQHRVRFTYRPRSFALGLGISSLAMLGSGIAALALLRRARASGP
jgi:hypothetical protein